MTVRTVLITGSTRYPFLQSIIIIRLTFYFSGIGLGIARAFAKAKYNIIFNGLEKNGSDIAANTAKEFQVDHMFSPANALHNDQLRAMVDNGLSRFKHIG
jgi:3-hydroxybutyrate dehydrogenase